MIQRVWRGWTSQEDADAYEAVLFGEVIPGIEGKKVPGYRGIRVLRRDLPDGDVEFMTVIEFDALDDVRGFVGDDYETAYVPDNARAVLARFEERASHYEVREWDGGIASS